MTSTTFKPADPHDQSSLSPLLVCEGICKRFGVTQALDDVSVSFLPGEVHALMGENGAGKSTLGKVIAGLHKQDRGQVTMAGRKLTPGSLDEAFDSGIRIVHQELAQCPNLSVAENLCLHAMPRTRFGRVDYHAMYKRARQLLADLEPGIDVEKPLGMLGPGHRQIVQIAGSLDQSSTGHASDSTAHSSGAKVIILDEPTSSLSISEVDRLLAIVRDLASRGLTLIYVSHRMAEIFQVCDRVTVLRDGRFVATNRTADLDEESLIEQMIGRRIELIDKPAFKATKTKPTVPLLRVRQVSSPGKLEGISLDVEPGEIVGLGGLVGSGRSELLDAIFGIDSRATGSVSVRGQEIGTRNEHAMIAAGVGYVPEDRKHQGLFFELGLQENLLVPIMPAISRSGIRRPGYEAKLAQERMSEFQIKAAGLDALPGSLSGGNQQKLLIARWMTDSTRVLLLDEPTRGIDVGTKAEIYKLIRAAANRGVAVLLVTSEMPELLLLSDRILVMCSGSIAGQLQGDDMTQSNILKLATVDSRERVSSGV